MRNALIIFYFGQVLYLAACTAPDPEPCTSCFDFSHVKLAIEYFDTPRDSLLADIAATPAALHLKRHSDRTGYYSADATPREITNDLVEKTPSPETLTAVRDLVHYADKNTARQKACVLEAAAYLPEEVGPSNPLYITWGYDIGVAMDDRASLNFTHTRFLDSKVLDRIVGAYWKTLSFLKSKIGAPLNEAHWQVVEDMSSGDRLWYVAGAAMAAEIESHQGAP